LQKLASQGLQDIVIIAIDHGEKERIKEYLPYYHPDFGQGDGPYYIQFMKEKLIPYVNTHYRTLTDYEHTGIGGSSMGGLISLYAGLTEPDVFGKMMIFSPSLWVSPMIFHDARTFKPLPKTKIYVYAGGKESKAHLPNVKKLESILHDKLKTGAYFDMEVSVNHQGKHGEFYWKQEFPEAINWLFFNNTNAN
jgi:predicted alpha/beta superfamily hydrolase